MKFRLNEYIFESQARLDATGGAQICADGYSESDLYLEFIPLQLLRSYVNGEERTVAGAVNSEEQNKSGADKQSQVFNVNSELSIPRPSKVEQQRLRQRLRRKHETLLKPQSGNLPEKKHCNRLEVNDLVSSKKSVFEQEADLLNCQGGLLLESLKINGRPLNCQLFQEEFEFPNIFINQRKSFVSLRKRRRLQRGLKGSRKAVKVSRQDDYIHSLMNLKINREFVLDYKIVEPFEDELVRFGEYHGFHFSNFWESGSHQQFFQREDSNGSCYRYESDEYFKNSFNKRRKWDRDMNQNFREWRYY